jgi:hypothetical protein
MHDLIHKHFTRKDVAITIVTPENISELYTAKNKVILFHAAWSGPSYMHMGAILDRLNTLDLKGLSLFFIDIDNTDIVAVEQLLGRQSHGMGEAVFIKSGSVVAEHDNNIQNFLKDLETQLG